MNGTMSVSHGLPAVIFSDTGDLHLQAKVPFVTEINTHLAQELEKPWRRFGRSGGVVGPSLPHTRQMSRRMSCHSSQRPAPPSKPQRQCSCCCTSVLRSTRHVSHKRPKRARTRQKLCREGNSAKCSSNLEEQKPQIHQDSRIAKTHLCRRPEAVSPEGELPRCSSKSF